MKEFNDLWRDVVARSQSFPVVQNYNELEYIYNLIQGCESYLEVGTAEGNSLYVLAHALAPNAAITYIDYGEKHTTGPRDLSVSAIEATGRTVTPILGDSNDYSSVRPIIGQRFDAVFIDAGHTDFNVAIDALFYGPLAKKFIIFHDIQIPDVSKVFEWYAKQRPDCVATRVVNSTEFGYGILEVKA